MAVGTREERGPEELPEGTREEVAPGSGRAHLLPSHGSLAQFHSNQGHSLCPRWDQRTGLQSWVGAWGSRQGCSETGAVTGLVRGCGDTRTQMKLTCTYSARHHARHWRERTGDCLVFRSLNSSVLGGGGGRETLHPVWGGGSQGGLSEEGDL